MTAKTIDIILWRDCGGVGNFMPYAGMEDMGHDGRGDVSIDLWKRYLIALDDLYDCEDELKLLMTSTKEK